MYRIHSFFLKLVFTLSILLSANLAVTPATASIVDFNFGGVVDYSSAGASFLGQTMSGLIKYEDETMDSNGLDGIGRYNGAITYLTVQFSGGHTVTMGGVGSNFIEIQQIGNADVYQLQAPVTGLPLDYFQVSIIHHPSAFSNSLFPPTLGMMSQSQFRLVFGNGAPNVVSGPLTAVPLPPAVILFGAGLAALMGLGVARGRQRGQKVEVEV